VRSEEVKQHLQRHLERQQEFQDKVKERMKTTYKGFVPDWNDLQGSLEKLGKQIAAEFASGIVARAKDGMQVTKEITQP
jgi:hypothetical protein